MQLSRKQVILISIVSGVILLLTLAAVLFLTPGEEEAADEMVLPTLDTVPPTAVPSPEITPSPTIFRLPLVPQWDTPWPTAG